MPSSDDLAHELALLFAVRNFKWKINGKMVIPGREEIAQTLDRAKELLYDEPVPSQLEVGRLLIKRYADDKFDVYIRLGELNDDSD